MLTTEELIASDLAQPETRTLDDQSLALIESEITALKEETGFTRWAQYSAASSMMGLAQIAEDLGLPIDFNEEEALMYRDMAELASEDNTIIGLAGMLAGSTMDIAGGSIIGGSLKGLGKLTGALGTQGWNNLFTQGLAGGAIGGFLEPILTEDDSTLVNVGLGTAFGGVLGGALAGASRLLRGPEPTPTPEAGQLALPAPDQPVGLLPSPEVATPRIPFQPGVEGKPATAGGVVPLGQADTGLPPIQGYPQGVPAAPGRLAPRGSATPIRPVESTKADSFDALQQVREDLLKITDNAPKKSDVNKAKAQVRIISKTIDSLNERIAKTKRGSGDQKRLIEERKKAQAELKTNQETLKSNDVSKQASVELARIDNGSISPLVLDRVANVAKKKPLARAVQETTPREPRPSAKAAATREAKLQPEVSTVQSAITSPEPTVRVGGQQTIAEPMAPPNVRLARETLGRRTEGGSASAMEVSPAKAMVDQDEIDRIPFRSTQAKEVQDDPLGQGGRVFTNAETRRRKMYQNAEDIGRQYFFQPEDLRGREYNFENVAQAADRLQDDINQSITEGNFKDAGDWLVKTFQESRTKTLTPVEQLVAARVFAIASDNLNKLLPMMRKMSKTNNLNSAEAVRMADDLQVTKELMTLMRQLERIDEASRRNISNALKNYKLANQYQKKHAAQLRENKIISDLFFGVACGG